MKFSRPLLTFSSLILLAAVTLSLVLKSGSGKSSKAKPPGDEDKWVAQQLASLTTEEKIAQSFMVACWSNRGEEHMQEIESQVANDKIGGVIFFQGERQNLLDGINRLQQKAKTPLLIGMDAEWGVAMRIFGEDRFPYAQTIGAANDVQLTKQMGEYMAIECDMLGIHMNFAPVADVNSNPKNPVIGFRAFGSDASHVSKHVTAFVQGMESQHVLSCIKHFPGHGDTDKDSHWELPTVSHTESEFRSVDFAPFKSGIAAGTSAVMVAHLNVPSLDDSGTPSSLSKKVIQNYLRKELGFKGLVISDALNMKAISEKYGKEETVAKAYIAGCDILLYPESVSEAIVLIKKKVDSKEIEMSEVDAHCKRILHAKYKAIIARPMVKREDPTAKRNLACAQVYEKAMVVLKNNGDALPLDRLDQKIARISIGTHALAFRESVDRYAKIEHHHFFTCGEAVERLKDKSWSGYDVVLVDFHSNAQRAKDNYGFGDWQKVAQLLPADAKVITTFFGNPLVLSATEQLPENIDACLLAYENNDIAQDRAGQFIMGAFDVNGKLEISLNDTWKKGAGLSVKSNGRLKYTVPEELGISSRKLSEIDAIVDNAIRSKALPGCQIVVAVKGKVIYRKAFGTTMYEEGDSVTNDHIYDIASITKIASSTMSLMKLKSEGKFDVNATLGELVPEIVGNGDYSKLKATDMLTHQAGLTPWIAFYKSTLSEGQLKGDIYSSVKKEGFSVPVAEGIWIRDDYGKVMLKKILETPLSGQKKYEYSDLGYYFFNAYIEKTTVMTQDKYVERTIFKPMGLRRIGSAPHDVPAAEQIQQERDRADRKRQRVP
jgi:beta-N-acetylhexosaminidase